MESSHWLRRLVILGSGGLDLQREERESLSWMASDLARDVWFHTNVTALILDASRLGTEAAQGFALFLQRARSLTEVRVDSGLDDIDLETQQVVDTLVGALACNNRSRLTEVSLVTFPSTAALFHDLLKAHYMSLEDVRTGDGHSLLHLDARDQQQVLATMLLPGSTLSKIIHIFVSPHHLSQLLVSLHGLLNLCNLKLYLYHGENPRDLLEPIQHFLRETSCPEVVVWNHTERDLDATSLLVSLFSSQSTLLTFGLFEFAIVGFSEQEAPLPNPVQKSWVRGLILEECRFNENSFRALTGFSCLQNLQLRHAQPRVDPSTSGSNRGDQEGGTVLFPLVKCVVEPLQLPLTTRIRVLDLVGSSMDQDELERLCLLLKQIPSVECLCIGPEYKEDIACLPVDGFVQLLRRLRSGLNQLVFRGKIERVEDAVSIVRAMERNTTLVALEGLEFSKELEVHKDLVEFYLLFNRRGRHLLEEDLVPMSLWPLVLARSSKDLAVLHGFVRGISGIMWKLAITS